jgi:hypothetical protein
VPRPSKIVQLGLEKDALSLRDQGRTLREIADALTQQLARAGSDETVSYPGVERYFASLDRATVAVAHRPQVAAENAAVSIDVAQRIRDSLVRLDQLLGAAEEESDGRPNWYATLGVIREVREHTKLYADLLERVYNVAHVEAFQRAVLRVLERQSLQVRAAVEAELAREQHLVRARLLGTVSP